MKHFIRLIFRFVARLVRERYQPMVVSVAGAVGKTAAKEAIAAAITTKKRSVRKTIGSFNAEIGVPVTIITGGSGHRSWWQWWGVLFRGLGAVIKTVDYPAVLVLEMAADHPGDLLPLLKLARPKISVLTSLAPEHLEYFGSEEAVIAEESLVIRQLPANGCAIVNIDDQRIQQLIVKPPVRQISFGWDRAAEVRAVEMNYIREPAGQISGLIITVQIGEQRWPVTLPGVIGRHQAYPLLAALAVGRALGDQPADSITQLSTYQPPPGRMRILPGIEGAMLIDDSYNASPEAVQAALKSLTELPVPGKKYAVLGQMSELGASTVSWHERIGRQIKLTELTELITVGSLAATISQSAIAGGFPSSHVHNVPDAETAAALLQSRLGPGDAVLIKGSRYASRLERAVRILLADPDRDAGKLVAT